jgi:hypothetical protein
MNPPSHVITVAVSAPSTADQRDTEVEYEREERRIREDANDRECQSSSVANRVGVQRLEYRSHRRHADALGDTEQ